MGEDQWVIVFNSTHEVLKGEKVLKGERVRVEVIPLPGHLSAKKGAECGLALLINGSKKKAAGRILTHNNVDFKGMRKLR